MFKHEKFMAYQKAIKFVQYATNIIAEVPQNHSSIKGQLYRAALSIPLNIAEGCGKRTIKDRDHFYYIARGSAMECAAILDVIKLLEIKERLLIDQGKSNLLEIVKILTTVCNKK